MTRACRPIPPAPRPVDGDVMTQPARGEIVGHGPGLPASPQVALETRPAPIMTGRLAPTYVADKLAKRVPPILWPVS